VLAEKAELRTETKGKGEKVVCILTVGGRWFLGVGPTQTHKWVLYLGFIIGVMFRCVHLHCKFITANYVGIK
jgi:hypothetical protein